MSKIGKWFDSLHEPFITEPTPSHAPSVCSPSMITAMPVSSTGIRWQTFTMNHHCTMPVATSSWGSEVESKMLLKARDSVFEEIIGIAREKGPLSAEDLTYLLQASKIVEKLKGNNA